MKQLIEKIKELLNQIPLPGFKGISILSLLKFLKEVFSKGNFAIRSAAVSFHFFVAIFPTLIFLVSLLPYLPIDGLQANLFIQMKLVLPDMIYSIFESTVRELFTRRYSVLLSVGFILSIFYASQGINTLLIAFNQSYQIELGRHPIKQRLISLGVFFIMMFLFLAALSVSIFGKALFIYFDFDTNQQLIKGVFTFFNFFTILIMVMLGISILYHYGHPKVKKFQFINPGTTFSTLVILLATWGLSVYFSNFNIYNKIYGSIGSLLIALIWINTVSYVLIIGFELFTKSDQIRNN
ncbi:MAG: hypothetical protein CL853_05800 [Crocinitomicaceae bacterium]|nr:hypothetical protein [Crocinitomicaceae bacterium]